MRPIPIITALITVAVLFLMVFQREAVRDFVGLGAEPSAQGSAGETAPGLERETVERVEVVAIRSTAQDIDTGVIVRGETRAHRSVTVVAETSGRLAAVPVTKGARVSAGDALCQLDPGTREMALTQARAQLAEAEKNLRNAEALNERGVAADTRVLSARSAFEAAQSAVEQARAALDDLVLEAPFDGLVEGDLPDIGTFMQPGAHCATVVALDPMRLTGYVAEINVARLEPGAPVGARLATGETMTGTLTFVGRSADPVTRSFKVEAEVPNPDLAIRDGQTVEMAIQSTGRSAHLVPQSALTLNDAGDLGVRVVGQGKNGDTARFQPVELVRDTLEGVWVAGLPDSAEVIVMGQDYVTDGVPVSVTYRESGT